MRNFLCCFLKVLSCSFCLTMVFACTNQTNEKPIVKTTPAKKPSLLVEAYVVKTKTLSEKLEVPGTLLPFEETDIQSEISGRLVELNIQEGRDVQQGVLLAKIFDDDLQAQLKKLKVQLGIAEKTLERQQELLKIQGVSQQEVDLSELEVNNIKADIELVQVAVSKTEIRAPFTGRLGLRNISVGAYISPADILTTIRQQNRLKLDFTVPEKHGTLFTKGKNVSFTIAGSSRYYNATVLATEAMIVSDTRSLPVRAVVQDKSNTLLPGAFAKVQFSIGGDDLSLIVPTQAIIPEARHKKVIIYQNGKPSFQIVETGIRDSSYIQVLEGLTIGDTILTTGLLTIREGSDVKLSKVH